MCISMPIQFYTISPSRQKTGTIKRLAFIQSKVALLIMGALNSTATNSVEIIANLLPFHLLVEKICYSAITWLASLPP